MSSLTMQYGILDLIAVFVTCRLLKKPSRTASSPGRRTPHSSPFPSHSARSRKRSFSEEILSHNLGITWEMIASSLFLAKLQYMNKWTLGIFVDSLLKYIIFFLENANILISSLYTFNQEDLLNSDLI